MFDSLGRTLVVMGIVLIVLGLGFMAATRFPPLGRLPGTLVITRDGFSCVFPVAASIVLSVLLTVILNLIIRLLGR